MAHKVKQTTSGAQLAGLVKRGRAGRRQQRYSATSATNIKLQCKQTNKQTVEKQQE